jgi:hypothetical protein
MLDVRIKDAIRNTDVVVQQLKKELLEQKNLLLALRSDFINLITELKSDKKKK